MLAAFGLNRNSFWGWLCASSIVLSLIVSGCVISPRRLPGGGTPTPTPTPSGTPTPTPGATPEGKLYVSVSGTNSIVRFDQALTASGNVVPAATISGANTKLSAPAYIFLDVANDRLYVANSGDLSIVIFDGISTKNGNVAPMRTIAGANAALVAPTDVSLDKGRDRLYVADDTAIRVWTAASTVSGDIAPARILAPGFAVSAILNDGPNDRLYVADQIGNAIHVYDNASALASGPITASRTLVGTNTHLSNPGGIQIDGAGRLVVSNSKPPGSITIFNNAAGVNGNVAPVAEIAGANTGFNVPDQIVVDTAGAGSVYNADPSAARVAIFNNLSTAAGNIAPNRSITGPGTTLGGGLPQGLALDTTR
jgi:hypothetical protein